MQNGSGAMPGGGGAGMNGGGRAQNPEEAERARQKQK